MVLTVLAVAPIAFQWLQPAGQEGMVEPAAPRRWARAFGRP
jgi:hypothetical protein